MSGNKVPPRSAYGLPPDRIDERNRRGRGGNTGNGSSGGPTTPPVDTSVFGRSALSLTGEEAAPNKQNPEFIWPGPDIVLGTTGERVKMYRGYVRKLNEFYRRALENKSIDVASVLPNMRCNFQFNPDGIARSIQANNALAHPFNQSPDQLAQPIPGQVGFTFDLMFNREAELHSKSYIIRGKTITAPDKWEKWKVNRYTGSPEFFINNPYDPAWVTEIGVLADIMVLDDILGVGLSHDMIKAVKSGTFSWLANQNSDSGADATDQTNNDNNATWDSNRLTTFKASANLGNKAFLLPSPIRIMFAPWMMVEGFVQDYQVLINKFTPEMIPSQASVRISMQALYVGFAQQKTFLTEIPDPAPSTGDTGVGGKPGQTIPPKDTPEREKYDDLVAGLANFIEKPSSVTRYWDFPYKNTVDLLDAVLLRENPENRFEFKALITKQGERFFQDKAKSIEFFVKGTIKIYWDSYVAGADGSYRNDERTLVRTEASEKLNSGDNRLLYEKGSPPKNTQYFGFTDYSIYGTKEKPLVLTLAETPCYLDVSGPVRDIFLGRTLAGGIIPRGTEAIWKWSIPKNENLPYEEDKFVVELELVLTAKWGSLPPVELPQRIVGTWNITANDDELFKNLSIRTSRPPGAVTGNSR